MYIGMMRQYTTALSEEDKLRWCGHQAYIALGNALNGAKSLGFDSCPMEGFDRDAFKKELSLDKDLFPVVICPVGIAADKPHPKLRYPKEELFVE